MSTQHVRFNIEAAHATAAFDEQREEMTAQLAQVAGPNMDLAIQQVKQLRAQGYNLLQALAVIIKVYEPPRDIRP